MSEAPPAWLETLLYEMRQLRREMAEHRAATSAPPVLADDPVARLRAEADALGIRIVMGAYITEADAARLLGRSKENLKYRRQNGEPIARRQKLLGRWCYSLADLAEITPEQLEDFKL